MLVVVVLSILLKIVLASNLYAEVDFSTRSVYYLPACISYESTRYVVEFNEEDLLMLSLYSSGDCFNSDDDPVTQYELSSSLGGGNPFESVFSMGSSVSIIKEEDFTVKVEVVSSQFSSFDSTCSFSSEYMEEVSYQLEVCIDRFYCTCQEENNSLECGVYESTGCEGDFSIKQETGCVNNTALLCGNIDIDDEREYLVIEKKRREIVKLGVLIGEEYFEENDESELIRSVFEDMELVSQNVVLGLVKFYEKEPKLKVEEDEIYWVLLDENNDTLKKSAFRGLLNVCLLGWVYNCSGEHLMEFEYSDNECLVFKNSSVVDESIGGCGVYRAKGETFRFGWLAIPILCVLIVFCVAAVLMNLVIDWMIRKKTKDNVKPVLIVQDVKEFDVITGDGRKEVVKLDRNALVVNELVKVNLEKIEMFSKEKQESEVKFRINDEFGQKVEILIPEEKAENFEEEFLKKVKAKCEEFESEDEGESEGETEIEE